MLYITSYVLYIMFYICYSLSIPLFCTQVLRVVGTFKTYGGTFKTYGGLRPKAGQQLFGRPIGRPAALILAVLPADRPACSFNFSCLAGR